MKKFDSKKWMKENQNTFENRENKWKLENKFGFLTEQAPAQCYACTNCTYFQGGTPYGESFNNCPEQGVIDIQPTSSLNFWDYWGNDQICGVGLQQVGPGGFNTIYYTSMENLIAASGSCGTGGTGDPGGDNIEPFANNEWDYNLVGCGNYDLLPPNIQSLACEAFNNLGDTNNPSLTTWVQNGFCCGNITPPNPWNTGSADTGSVTYVGTQPPNSGSETYIGPG